MPLVTCVAYPWNGDATLEVPPTLGSPASVQRVNGVWRHQAHALSVTRLCGQTDAFEDGLPTRVRGDDEVAAAGKRLAQRVGRHEFDKTKGGGLQVVERRRGDCQFRDRQTARPAGSVPPVEGPLR